MILGIDASNIRAGGGLSHLAEVLHASDPRMHGFSRVIVWGGRQTLDRIKDAAWLVKSHQRLLDGRLPHRIFWQRSYLSWKARAAGCHVLFVPGGSYSGSFHPMVSMSQNLLPFEWSELRRYGWSGAGLKQLMLRWTQSRTFRRADGLIFLTQYAKEAVASVVKSITGRTAIISHGVHPRFLVPPREPRSIGACSVNNPFRILYVSTVDMYKHQWNVAKAVTSLRRAGFPVVLDLVGSGSPPALTKLHKTLNAVDPSGEVVSCKGALPYEELHTHYAAADLNVFASSCESFGQILTEAMSAGLPIACSNRSSMPETLGDAGEYFDPENSEDIAGAIRVLIESPLLRAEKARAAFERARQYSWNRCSEETFRFLSGIGIGHMERQR